MQTGKTGTFKRVPATGKPVSTPMDHVIHIDGSRETLEALKICADCDSNPVSERTI